MNKKAKKSTPTNFDIVPNSTGFGINYKSGKMKGSGKDTKQLVRQQIDPQATSNARIIK